MAMHDIIIRIKSILDATGFEKAHQKMNMFRTMAQKMNKPIADVKRAFEDSTYSIIDTGTAGLKIQDKMTGKFVSMKNVTKNLRVATKRFNMEWLSAMFLGMQLSNMMKGLINPSLKLTGTFDLMGTILGTMFLPAATKVRDAIMWIWDKYKELTPEQKQFINDMVLAILVIGTFLAFIFGLALGIQGLAWVISGIITIVSFFGWWILVIIGIIIAVILIITHWEDIIKWLGKAWDWLKEKIGNVVKGIITFLGNVVSNFVDWGKEIIYGIIDGIKKVGHLILDTILSFLPEPIRNWLTGVGGAVGRAVGGIFGFQYGGLVTRPTLGMLGERGPEVVVPLNRIPSLFSPTINIEANITSDIDIDYLAYRINEILRYEYSRGVGR